MLTFRAGAASPSSGGAGKMADHLMNMTLPATEQDMATYYQRGMVFEGGIWKPGTAPAESNQAATASDAARPGTIPEPRRDMDPAVAGKLGIDVSRPLSRDEIAELLAVKRADGLALPAIEPEAVPEQRPAKPEATDDDEHDAALAAEAAALAELGSAPSGPPDWLDETPPAEAAAGPVAGDRDAALTAERLADADRGGEAALPPRGPAAEETPAEPRTIDVAAAFEAAGVPYRSSGGRLRLQATWRSVDSWTVSVNATTGQWRDFAASEGGRFESLVRRLGVKAEAVALDPEAAKAAREAETRRSAFRKGIAGKLWADATPGAGELRGPLLNGSAGQKMRQRAEHAARVADAEVMRATARAYLSGRGLDADWLLDHVRLVRPHANYDAREIAAGASVVMLTPMYGQDDAGAVQLTGVQRTYLTEAGEKIGRRMLGASGAWLLHPPAGEAVAIGGHDRAWVVGEGFETVASVVQATRQAGVVGYNAGGLIVWAGQFHGSTPIAVLADRDNPRIFNGRDVGETGQKAAAKAVSLIEANGGEAVYLEPPARIAGGAKGADWADALREAGRDGLRQTLAEAGASSPADRARIEAKTTPAAAPAPAAEPVPAEHAASPHPELVRLYKALGVKDGRTLTEAERANILDGKRADGAALDTAAWRDAVNRSKTPIGYLDFTFSADKSVSLAWAFAPTEAERNQFAQAHKDAVAATMAEIEQVIGQARKGKGGQDGTEQGRIGWITFDHYTARPTLEIARQTSDGRTETEIVPVKIAGDPQLHTHVAVPNLIVTDSGRVVSLNTMRMHGRIHEWGAIYQAHLGQNLRRLGARVELDRTTDAARLSAVPEAIRTSFSKRTRDALADAKAYAASVGADWDRMSADERIKLLKGGAFASRTAKADDLSDFASWRRQAEARGYRHQSVLQGESPARPLAEIARLDLAYETAARVLGDQFERRAVIKGEAERVAAARGLVAAGIKDGTDVDQVIARLRVRGVAATGVAGARPADTAPALTPIIAVDFVRDAPENPSVTITETRLTTRAHVAQESALVELAATAGRDRRGTLNPAQIKRGIVASGLTFTGEHGAAQRRMIDHLGMGGRFAVGIGAAGAGKTTLLRPLVASWQAQGADIHGISLGWRQARELREAGLNTDAEKAGRDTIAAVSVFINRVETGRLDLTNRSVVVIDELGTIGTRQMLELLRLQERHGFRMVAIGDPRQCQSIEAGQVIGLLEKALGKVLSIETTVRQTNERAREIAGLLRQGGAAAVGEALEMKRQDGTAEIVAGGYREVIERAADLWRERVRANADRPRYTLSISTPTNEDARAIGEAIRHRLQAAGALGRNRMTIAAIDKNTGEQYAMPIAPGEKVRLFARTNAAMTDGGKGAIGDNGSILEIASIRRAGLVLRTDNGREGFVKWGTLADTASGRVRLAYGYAMTTNTAQGITTSEHIFVTPGGSQTTDGFKTYVSGSRHRERDYWLTSEGAERQEIAGRRPLGDPRPIREHDIWTNWTRNIARQPEKTNALDIVQTAEAGRRQAARDFLKGLAKDERRQAAGARDDLPRRFQHARIRVTEQGRLTESMARVARYREAAMARIERAAPSVRQAVAASWERARPVIEVAYTAARERLRAALAAQRRREDQRRVDERRQAEARKAEQQSQRRGRGR